MENSESILKQLKIIKWLLAFIVASILITTGTIVFYAITMSNFMDNEIVDKSCNNENFRDKASELLDQDKLEDVIKLANERIKSYPNDENAYWYRGKAYYLQKKWQLAINDFNKTEELAPSWKEEYTEPFRLAAQSKLKKR